MADNVAITAGTGTSIATDDVAGVHYQRFKLATAEDGSAEPIGDDDKGASRSLWTTHRPNRVETAVASAGLTTATTAYTAGDVLGTGWEFTNFARAAGGSGLILGAALLDKADITSTVDLYLASAAITFGADNAAPSISDTDAEKLLQVISIPLEDLGGSRFGALSGLSVPYVCDATSLFVYAVTRVAHTFFGAATDLRLRLHTELG